MKHFDTENIRPIIFYLVIILCISPLMSAPMALVLGALFSFFKIGLPQINASRVTKYLLQTSVVLIGFSMNLSQVIQTSKTGFWLTVFSVTLTLLTGLALGLAFKVDRKTALLISCGTAICGGSAIAAVSPLIDAKKNQVSFALAVVFLLNAVALILFPFVGRHLHLSQEVFGYWAAIAIHDTSSVVGAGSAYGQKALEIATTVKLTRALWIIPVSLVIYYFTKKEKGAKVKIPWFIGLFLAAILLRHLTPGWNDTFAHLSWLGQKGMMIALFLIGSSLSTDEISSVGWRPFIMGITLWLAVSVISVIFLTL